MLLPLLLACESPDPEASRRAWMQEELTRADAVWLARNADGVAAKYRRMAADPYDFLRGSSPFWYADLARPDAERSATAFLRTADAASVLLVGDPHPENFGLCLPGDEPDAAEADPEAPLTLEAVDLDASVFGPWIHDLRRGALGLVMLADGAGCDAACATPAVRAMVAAYADEIARRDAGETGWAASEETEADGRILRRLRDDSREDGVAQKVLEDYAPLFDDQRRLLRDEDLDEDGRGVLALDDEEEAQVARLLEEWQAVGPEGVRVLDAARRYGSGVASLPATRYLVLWDRGDDGPADDRLLNVREVVDPPAVQGRGASVPALFDNNAARVESTSWMLWSRPDSDILTAGLADGVQTFKVTSFSGWFQTLDHDDVADDWAGGKVDEADLESLGAVLGRALASSHARGPVATGTAALGVIARDIDGRSEELVVEISAQVLADRARLLADHALFLQLLEHAGPLLGAADPPTETW